jgi:hypothetical protein
MPELNHAKKQKQIIEIEWWYSLLYALSKRRFPTSNSFKLINSLIPTTQDI